MWDEKNIKAPYSQSIPLATYRVGHPHRYLETAPAAATPPRSTLEGTVEVGDLAIVAVQYPHVESPSTSVTLPFYRATADRNVKYFYRFFESIHGCTARGVRDVT